eukprot:TRINITY_DN24611_c0_g1_i3.p3 TRINITY_DN24611_c0_g1~~TRINITY_DN24611_c0_g1_i3.p3  ORF type:complete len:115 (+),score=4.42 TRINITY_DN24611_c0_g1_i3:129-473(+)
MRRAGCGDVPSTAEVRTARGGAVTSKRRSPTLSKHLHQANYPCLNVKLLAVGERDVTTRTQIRDAGCERCVAYKSIRVCGHCMLRRRRERVGVANLCEDALVGWRRALAQLGDP